MRSKLQIILITLFLVINMLNFNKVIHAATFRSNTILPNVDFGLVSLTEEKQIINEGNGNIIIQGQLLNGGLSPDSWKLQVQANQFTSISGPPLPVGTLQLNTPPNQGTCLLCLNVPTANGPWDIDSGEVTQIISGSFVLGILGLGSYNFNYSIGNPPFRLNIFPNLQMIYPNETSSIYTTTITWIIVAA